MIYAVGITLVVVIALMLTNPKLEMDMEPSVPTHKMPGVVAGIVVFITIYLALRSEIWQVHNMPYGANPVAPNENILRIGTALLSYYALPFEFASVLLLIALVGAVMLAKADQPSRPSQSSGLDEEIELYERKEADVAKV
jgi:NADH-quinone oxidoreductase subunit J